ncbi:Pyridoxamine 5'-phosphate oxidase putative domain-containing protein OS=Streptomyces aurantiogriseus OX=66870 GN=GCM10010251_82630 PE=4 SV=1 [Streptomyces aurantiogriseus]|uniref:Pyridoxamine 5'-phosphate oxidase N-terminal domain-containing protein n=1 Tax=Streptomyces aurantiogriseus TaxID=66870 RepID=A0A918FNC9_9ACTN|nr:hypothetical protein GCM10010251_82630 [Streptomyces aurantiogriseus]
MSKPPLPPEAVELLRRPNPCVMAALRSDGIPVSTPTRYLWDNGRALISLDEGRIRLRHLRRDPRVTLTVLDGEDWYTHVTLIGRVVETYEDEGLADIDRIATLPQPRLRSAGGMPPPASPTRTGSAPASARGSRPSAGTAGAR